MTSPLDAIRIAKPCPARWEDLEGDERTRHCASCDLDVFNVAGLSESEAVALLRGPRTHLCLRIYRRADGTVLTRDCPVGLRAARRRAALIATALIAGALAMVGLRRLRVGSAPPATASAPFLGSVF
ncbi:MAG TPA: hypothetical protein VKE69_07985 [Planctomycetota bacterium]|nr:hypothetical protein [Planctomycetota bacterium]